MSLIDLFANATANQSCNEARFVVAKHALFFIPLIYGIPTIILYFHVIYAILRNHSLRNEFYKLYVLYSLLTVIMWTWDMVTTRFLALGYWCDEMLRLWGSFHYYLTPFQFVMTYSRHAQFYAATVLALNRMTAVVYPLRYSEVWLKHFNYSIIVVLLLPLATTWFILPFVTQGILIKSVVGGLILTYYQFLPNPWNSTSAMTVLVGAICSVVIIFATIMTSVSLRKINRQIQRAINKQERSQFFVGTVTSVTACLLAAVEVPMNLLNQYVVDVTWLYTCQCIKEIMIDILLVFSPWATVCVSSAMRRALREIYFHPQKRMSIVDFVIPGRASLPHSTSVTVF